MMDIVKAKKIKAGDWLNYPADRGNPAGRGQATHDCNGADVHHNHNGVTFIWVALRDGRGVWPSNRLNNQ